MILYCYAIDPEFYNSPDFMTEFFVKYARVVDFAGLSLLKWILYCLTCFFLVYFSGSYIMNYYYYKSLKKARIKFKNRFLENMPKDLETDDSLQEKMRAYREKNSFSTVSVSHSIIYDN
jgi:hypothetical protein